MSLIPALEVKRSQARSATDAQGLTAEPVAAEPVAAEPVAAEPVAAEALIAEARAHARRRRLKIAVALVVLAATALAAVLIGRATIGSHRVAQTHTRPAAPAAGTGIVTGHLAACFGIPPPNGSQAVTPGTVVALRGHITWKPTAPGSWMLVYPKGPAVASQHISDNYDQTFRFALPPGHYVIAGHYDGHAAGDYGPVSEVTVRAGASIRVDLPNICP
jgi:hypothetical protein